MGNTAEYPQATWDDIFAWGEDVARRGGITKERSRELMREVRAMSSEERAAARIQLGPLSAGITRPWKGGIEAGVTLSWRF